MPDTAELMAILNAAIEVAEGAPRDEAGDLTEEGASRVDRVLSLTRKHAEQFEEGEYHGPTPPGEGWQEISEGPRGGKVWRKVKDAARGAAQAAGGAVKEKLSAAVKELKPASIWNRVKQAASAVRHPVESVKKVGNAALSKFKSLHERYGAAGATAIAGAYAGYYAVAAANPVLFTVPVPLTLTVLGSARCIRYGILKARGKPVEFAEMDELEAAKQFISSLAQEAGEEPPELDDDVLSEIIDHLKQQAEESQGFDDDEPEKPEAYSTSWGYKLREKYGEQRDDLERFHERLDDIELAVSQPPAPAAPQPITVNATINVPEGKPPVVHVAPAQVVVEGNTVIVPAPAPQTVERPKAKRIERDGQGNIIRVVEEDE